MDATLGRHSGGSTNRLLDHRFYEEPSFVPSLGDLLQGLGGSPLVLPHAGTAAGYIVNTTGASPPTSRQQPIF